MKRNKEVMCYEILNNDDEFQNFFQLKKHKELGSGGFAKVYRAVDKLGQTFALKLFIDHQKYPIEEDVEKFTNMSQEQSIIYQLNCDHVVRILGIAYSFENNESSMGIVEELMDRDLKSFLTQANMLSFTKQLDIAISLANAFLVIHHKDFVHHDIKPENILIKNKENGEIAIKISDFGTCLKVQGNDEKYLTGLTFDYAAPENILHLCFGEQFLNDPKSDIWSWGIVFYRIIIENKKIGTSIDDVLENLVHTHRNLNRYKIKK